MKPERQVLRNPAGKIVCRGTEDDFLRWIHEYEPCSYHSAIHEQGYRIEPERIVVTTWEHFEKYNEMRKRIGLWFESGTGAIFNGRTRDELLALYDEDNAFNSIPLAEFDGRVSHLRNKRGGPRSMAENTCVQKHALIFDVVQPRLVVKWHETGSAYWLADDGTLMHAPMKSDRSGVAWFHAAEVDFDAIDNALGTALLDVADYLTKYEKGRL